MTMQFSPVIQPLAVDCPVGVVALEYGTGMKRHEVGLIVNWAQCDEDTEMGLNISSNTCAYLPNNAVTPFPCMKPYNLRFDSPENGLDGVRITRPATIEEMIAAKNSNMIGYWNLLGHGEGLITDSFLPVLNAYERLRDLEISLRTEHRDYGWMMYANAKLEFAKNWLKARLVSLFAIHHTAIIEVKFLKFFIVAEDMINADEIISEVMQLAISRRVEPTLIGIGETNFAYF